MITHPLWDLGALVLIALAILAAVRSSWAFMRFVLLITALYVLFT